MIFSKNKCVQIVAEVRWRHPMRSYYPGALAIIALWKLELMLVAVWLSGNILVSINVVTLCQARLVLGWVTVCGWINYLGMLPAT